MPGQRNLIKRCKVTRLANASAAGTSDVTSSSIDMAGYDSVMFGVLFGAIVSGAVTSIKVRQDTVTGMGSAADLTGTSITVADTDDNKITLTEIFRPLERFLDVVVSKATQNSTVDGIFAIQFNASGLPTTQDATTTLGNELHLSPVEGTA